MTRPTVTLKIATSLDGHIATAAGESKWITGEAAREEVHRLRAAHDAVLVGSQTVLDDDPELTVRLPGYEGPQPLRVVADARLRTPKDSRLFQTATEIANVVVVTDARGDPSKRISQQYGGTPDPLRIVFLHAPRAHTGDGLDAGKVLGRIHMVIGSGKTGSPSVLLEGGGRLAASFLRAGLVDRIEWFRAPIILGGDGKPAVAALELGRLADAPRFKRLDVRVVGDDLWERYERLS